MIVFLKGRQQNLVIVVSVKLPELTGSAESLVAFVKIKMQGSWFGMNFSTARASAFPHESEQWDEREQYKYWFLPS